MFGFTTIDLCYSVLGIQAYATEVCRKEYNHLALAVVRCSNIIIFCSSVWEPNVHKLLLLMYQVSSSRGIGLIIGPAIGGYLAQVTIYCHLHRKLIFALVHKPVMILLFCLFWPYSWPRKFRGRTYLFFFQWSFTKC